MKKGFIIAGGVLSIYGLFLCTVSNLNLGVLLTLFLGILLFLWGVLWDKVNTQKGVMKYIRRGIVLFLCLELLLVGFLAIYGQTDNIHYKEDAVVILGAGVHGNVVSVPLKLRLDKAVEYHKENPNALIIVTGGKGFQETVTEASAMEEYLIRQGVPKEIIIKEEQATSTNENMRFSKEILDAYFGEKYEMVVITNHFHIYRAVEIAKEEGFQHVSHMHAELQWYNLIPCFLRESLAVLKMWVLG